MKKTPFQLAMLFGEGAILASAGAALYIVISRVSGSQLLGQYSLIFAWLMLFQSIGSFGIPEFLLKEMGAHAAARSKYLVNGLVIGMVSALLSAGVMVGMVSLFAYEPPVKQGLYVSAILLVPMMLNAICRGTFLAESKAQFALLVTTVESAVVVTVNTYQVLHGCTIDALIVTLVVAKSFTVLLSVYLTGLRWLAVRNEFSGGSCRQLLPPIFTFALSNALGLVATRINVIMLSWWSSLSVVGLYAAASKLVEVALMIPSIFAQMLLPRVARTFSQRNGYDLTAHHHMLFTLFALVAPVGMGSIYFADDIVLLLFGPAFLDSAPILQVLMLFFLVETGDMLMGIVLKAAGLQRKDVQLFAANPFTNIVLNIFLIPILGMLGAALAKLAGVLVSTSLRYAYLRRHVMQIPWYLTLAKPVGTSLLLLSFCVPLSRHVHFLVLSVLYALLNGVFLFLLRDRLRPS
jgi:O-antigen/teichoic acid export membrane protein